MRELEVREALYNFEIRKITEREPLSLIIDELGVMEGAYRIDLAVINSKIRGYEIKSAADNLDRLAAQQASYSMIFDQMTLVADAKHVPEAVKIVPGWWGLISVSSEGGRPVLNEIWPSRQNVNVDKFALAQLLWRPEALDVLKERGLDWGVRTKARRFIWEVIARELSHEELRAVIAKKLAARADWRKPDRPRKRRKKSGHARRSRRR